MRNTVRLGRVWAGVVLAGVLGGCSTVIFSEHSSTERTTAIEREALIEAAAAVSRTQWPKPENASWQARIVHIGASRLSQSDAVDAYLASLGGDETRYVRVLDDAGAHLRAADGLTRAAANAAQSVRPVTADISIVEAAIGDLRQTRDIYVEALKVLDKQGEPVPAASLRQLKSDFDSAIKQLGAVADELADRVADDHTETFAGPTRRDTIDGSL